MTFQLVSPDELEKEILKESGDKVEELLKKIDKALRDSAKSLGSGSANAAVDISGFNQFVIDKVIQKCRQSGWEAKVNYDQRDGNYIQVTKSITKQKTRLVPLGNNADARHWYQK